MDCSGGLSQQASLWLCACGMVEVLWELAAVQTYNPSVKTAKTLGDIFTAAGVAGCRNCTAWLYELEYWEAHVCMPVCLYALIRVLECDERGKQLGQSLWTCDRCCD